MGPNPALGLRALRLSLRRPALFRTQVRAVLRAAAHGDVRLLLPLVTTLAELRAARALVEECVVELEHDGLPHQRVPIGAMIEVPAAAIRAERFAREADFLSVGTNDLVQYTLATDRGDSDVAGLADPLDPSVLALLAGIVEGAAMHDREVTMCGDMAADPLALLVVLGLGYRRLSMPLAALPFVQEAIRRVDAAELAALAADARLLDTAGEVRALVRARLMSELGALWREQGLA
jgi:phosphotransferase system enzyme I (PtsI)